MCLKVLVLGMGSNVSQAIVKALRDINDIDIYIIGACVKRSSVGLYLCDESLLMPLASDEEFVDWYINKCNEKRIDIAFTGVEANIDVLVNNREEIQNSCKTRFVYPDKDVWNIGKDKYYTCKWLKENDIPYPDYAIASDDSSISRLIERCGFPLIAKPRCGKSSLGVIRVESSNDLSGIIGRKDYLVQELIGNEDEEFTVGCYFSKSQKLVSRIVLHRYIKNGSTSMAEIVDNRSINDLVDDIANRITMSGPLNLQIRLRNDGTPVCFEWNVRYSGTTAIRSHFGFRDVYAAIREYVLGESIDLSFKQKEYGVVIRVEDEIYLDNTCFAELYENISV